MNLHIVNIVAVVKLSSTLNLDELALILKDSERCTRGGNWVKIRLQPENYYIAFYKSGKFLITGVKSIEIVENVADRVLSLLKEAKMDLKKENIKVYNITMTGAMEMRASLEKIVFALDSAKVSYEPEQFHCLIYRDYGACFLLFPSGKLIITGSKESKLAEEATEKFKKLIEDIK